MQLGPFDPPVPTLLAGAYALAVAVALVAAATTSGAAFDAHNPGWEGLSGVRDTADAAAVDTTVATELEDYDRVHAEDTVVLLVAPAESSPEHRERLRSVAEGGGTVVVAAQDPAVANPLLSDLGTRLRVDGGPLRDERRFSSTPAFPLVTDVRDHPYVRHAEGSSLNYGTAIAVASEGAAGGAEDGSAGGVDAGATDGASGESSDGASGESSDGTSGESSDGASDRSTVGDGTAPGAHVAVPTDHAAWRGGGPTALANTSDYAYVDRNGNDEPDSEELLASRAVVATDRVGSGEVVVVSDPSVFINAMVERRGNRALVAGLLGDHRQLVLDRLGTDVPPLFAALATLREQPPLGALVGLSPLLLVLGWERRPVRGVRRTVGRLRRRRTPERRARAPSEDPRTAVDPDALEAYLEREHPELDDRQRQRVLGGVMGVDAEAGRDDR